MRTGCLGLLGVLLILVGACTAYVAEYGPLFRLKNDDPPLGIGPHACAVLESGGVKCWGANGHGQLGDGTTEDRDEPVEVVGLAGAIAVSAGGAHTCALTRSGQVFCWGSNQSRQLGDGSSTDHWTAVAVQGLPPDIVVVSAGAAHTCALTSAGAVKCWGSDSQIQPAATGADQCISHDCGSSPLGVPGLGEGVTSITAGGAHTCAVLATGAGKCWGFNSVGQLGDGEACQVPCTALVDIQVADPVAQVAIGDFNTCVLTRAGAVKCVGDNFNGELGGGTRGDLDGDADFNRNTFVDTVGLERGVVSISSGGSPSGGSSHTCALLETGGVVCWGDGFHGQLGNGKEGWQDEGRTAAAEPVGVSGLDEGVIAVAAGRDHTCALTDEGSVKCWGGNFWGQVGDGRSGWRHERRTKPVQVKGLNKGVVAIAASR